ncbi:competence type IV pilus minor pilin ComGD [Marinococcus halotolerans]|uniref:competence type IV pilus minor pilin ComGD n=1 Tax=Marinococcus halotolerans TaxID=301092 RepID=UPI0003B51829|nr:competence type IV pilus minor pilin ComGD [Marinococcus halotolerans]
MLLFNSKGYTFPEAIVVLLVFSVLAAVPFIHFSSAYQSTREDHFVRQLEADLVYSQHYAYTHHTPARLNWHAEENYYALVSNDRSEPLIERTIPEGFFAPTASKLQFYELSYTEKGNIKKAGTATLHGPSRSYRFIFQIGRGRLRVETSS